MRTILAGFFLAAQAAALGAEFAAWPVSPLERIWPDSAAEGGAPQIIEAEGARGEVVTAQLAVRTEVAARVRLCGIFPGTVTDFRDAEIGDCPRIKEVICARRWSSHYSSAAAQIAAPSAMSRTTAGSASN